MLDPKALERLSRLARLELPASEAQPLRTDLEHILEYVAVLQKEGAESRRTGSPARRAVGAHWRPDEPAPGLSNTDALAPAPEARDGYFAVPTVVVSESLLDAGTAAPARAAHAIKPDVPGEVAGPSMVVGLLENHLDVSLSAATRSSPPRADAAIDATDLLARIREGETTARAEVERCLRRAAAWEPTLHALVAVGPASALRKADEIDRALRQGDAVGPLAGLP
ncbi:MAG: hypothetical protein KC729_10535, partial [Candidatus Eisenbacteria bacterium]|nr:hypothetical protein [Candidatus Eisenbacteria bacterium]